MSMERNKTIYETLFKRLIDFMASLIAIIILSPLLAIVAILVRIKLGAPVIFKQSRPGKNEKLFNMLKFRSMTNEKDENGDFLPDEIRLTKFGKAIRKLSIDELPQLFNILKGDMSIVGPRPKLTIDLLFMDEEKRKRHLIRPGLTGLAQVSGRNDLNWHEVLNLDVKYVNKVTFWQDFKIIIKTVGIVFKKQGISHAGRETTEDYGDYLLRNDKITLVEYENIMKKHLNNKKDQTMEKI